MAEATHLESTDSNWATATPWPTGDATPSTPGPPSAASTLLPWDDWHMQAHTVLIVVVFCAVCLLLLLAFAYTFCFHCTIGPSPKDARAANTCGLEREDTTFRRSSSDGLSVGNVV